jgi:hypothetical protein
MVSVSGRVVTLTGSLGNNNRIFVEIVKSVCPAVEVRNQMTETGPECPQGSRSCITLDGEQYCCTGCRVCPVG